MVDLLLPSFETARLILRPSTPDDARDLWEFEQLCMMDPQALRFMQVTEQTLDEVRTRLEARERLAREDRTLLGWHLRLRGEPALVGHAAFVRWNHGNHRSEVAYGISPNHRGKGLSVEAFARLLEFAWSELGLHRAEAHMDPENVPSIRTAEKLGFSPEGRFRESHYWRGRYHDTLVYAKLTGDSRGGAPEEIR
jgi:ribosomal-protein-alanine N-acetyltransferase